MSSTSGQARTVVTFGTFDVFHVGHLRVIERAAALGERLVVGVSADALNLRKKGREPVFSQAERMEIVGALKVVDERVRRGEPRAQARLHPRARAPTCWSWATTGRAASTSSATSARSSTCPRTPGHLDDRPDREDLRHLTKPVSLVVGVSSGWPRAAPSPPCRVLVAIRDEQRALVVARPAVAERRRRSVRPAPDVDAAEGGRRPAPDALVDRGPGADRRTSPVLAGRARTPSPTPPSRCATCSSRCRGSTAPTRQARGRLPAPARPTVPTTRSGDGYTVPATQRCRDQHLPALGRPDRRRAAGRRWVTDNLRGHERGLVASRSASSATARPSATATAAATASSTSTSRTSAPAASTATARPSAGPAASKWLASGYCVLDNDFAGRSSARPPREPAGDRGPRVLPRDPVRLRLRRGPWLMEATATWMEERVADDVNDNRQYLPHGQVGRPGQSLDRFDRGGFNQYGNWAFFEYLSSRYGARSSARSGTRPTSSRAPGQVLHGRGQERPGPARRLREGVSRLHRRQRRPRAHLRRGPGLGRRAGRQELESSPTAGRGSSGTAADRP